MKINPKYTRNDKVFFLQKDFTYPLMTYIVTEGKVRGFSFHSQNSPQLGYQICYQPKRLIGTKQYYDTSLYRKEIFNSRKEALTAIPKRSITEVKKRITDLKKRMKMRDKDNKKTLNYLNKELNKLKK